MVGQIRCGLYLFYILFACYFILYLCFYSFTRDPFNAADDDDDATRPHTCHTKLTMNESRFTLALTHTWHFVNHVYKYINKLQYVYVMRVAKVQLEAVDEINYINDFSLSFPFSFLFLVEKWSLFFRNRRLIGVNVRAEVRFSHMWSSNTVLYIYMWYGTSTLRVDQADGYSAGRRQYWSSDREKESWLC